MEIGATLLPRGAEGAVSGLAKVVEMGLAQRIIEKNEVASFYIWKPDFYIYKPGTHI